MAIKLDKLVVGEVYFGWHKEAELFYFLRYLGENKWSAGLGSLYKNNLLDIDPYSKNDNQIIPYCHIKAFPQNGNWSKQKALEVNNFKLQRAWQATENWFDINFSNTGWTIESLTNHFFHSDVSITEFYAKKNEINPQDFNWFYNVEGSTPTQPTITAPNKPIKVTKYRIINCVKDKELYKECPNT